MRAAAGILVLAACGGSPRSPAPSPAPPPTATPAATDDDWLVCPKRTGRPAGERLYRRLPDDAALLTLKNAIDAGGQPEPQRAGTSFEGLSQALGDSYDDVRRCMAAADRIEPSLQYSLEVKMYGRRGVGTYVTGVQLKRLGGWIDDRSPELVPTTAEACVARLFSHLDLPGSAGSTMMVMIVRYDGCTPKMNIAKAHVDSYARETFLAWRAAHPTETCPATLAALGANDVADPWGRPYTMTCTKDGIVVESAGLDGIAGNDDDISSAYSDRLLRGDASVK